MTPGIFAPICAVLLLCAPLTAAAQGFGQNRVRIRDFKWRVLSTEHFDIHYYDGTEPLAPTAARMLERSYARISKDLGVTWEGRKPFFLYATPDEMQQTNIADIGPGTGGVTEAFKDRFMVFTDGSEAWLDTVITHELAHVFQFHALVSGFWKSGRILKTIIYPLWMMEGMAEFYSWGFDDTAGEVIVRDAATSGGLIPLYKLEKFSHLKPHQVRLAYESGSKVLEFVESQYGKGKVAKMLKLFESKFETTTVLQELLGVDVFDFDKRFREYAAEKYGRQVRLHRLSEPEAYGEALTRAAKLPEENSSAVFTPDGKSMAFLSTRDGYPAGVYLQDLATGKTRKLVARNTRVEQLHTGHFTNKSRALSMSKDGKRLVFAGTKNHRPYLFFYDLERRKLDRLPVAGLQALAAPAFSPDGKSVAFSAMRGGVTDIYLLDLETAKWRQVTDDARDDQTPDFSPDGGALVYSVEIREPGSAMLYQRRLYRVNLKTGAAERLLDIPGAARDPVHSADGKRVIFSLEYDGFYDAYELDLAAKKAYRLTRSIGAAYTPSYDPAGRIVFSGFRRGTMRIYRGDRARFLAEPWTPKTQAAEEPFKPAEALSARMQKKEERDYKPSYSTDLFLPAFFFSTQGGLFWTSYWQGSDMLGDHQLLSFLSYASGPGYLNYQNVYGYNRYRTKFQVGAVGRARKEIFDDTSNLTANEFAHSEFVTASYPFDQFHRLDLTLASVVDNRSFLGTLEEHNRDARIVSTELVRDTVTGRYLVAQYGSRLRLGYLASPRVLGGNFVYQHLSAEAHKYFPTGGLSALVLRGVGLRAWGPETPQLILGGIGGVRGYGRSTTRDAGSGLAMGTAEWRVPVLSNLDYYMWYIFPDFYFKAISLSLFTDVGATWHTRSEFNALQGNDLRHSYGVGLRLHTFILQLFPLVLHFDYARRTTSPGGVFYVYIGPLF